MDQSVRKQRLVDPESCSACLSCYEACPTGAIEIRGRRVAIDPALCANCGACEAECSTGAIMVIRDVLSTAPYSLAEQFGWDRLPAEEV